MVVIVFFKYPATPDIDTALHTLSLHDALPILAVIVEVPDVAQREGPAPMDRRGHLRVVAVLEGRPVGLQVDVARLAGGERVAVVVEDLDAHQIGRAHV